MDWQEVWQEIADEYDEMKIPVRIYRVGIRYLQTGDEKVLYDLVQEEREILKQALEIELIEKE